jgi:glycosyltransferase involved in cell wall biosynthesis
MSFMRFGETFNRNMSNGALKISVVMSVYNAELYIAQAIESILAQTYDNFEFIIIDDGSQDDSLKLIESYKDRRIKFKSRANKGMPASLNEAIGLANGKYIARQDADDISLPERLEKQVTFLENNPEIGLLGTNIEVVDENNKKADKKRANVDLLTSPDDLKLAEVFSNQFAHGSVMVKKETLDAAGLYDLKVPISEDYDLWTRISRTTGIANLKEPLYKWRLHTENISTSHKTASKVQEAALNICAREFDHYLEHKGEYKLFSFHPFSMRGGLRAYLLRKSSIYRDMAIMHCRYGLRRKAVPIIMLAILHSPWLKKNYRQLFMTIVSRKKTLAIEYELF